MKILMVADLHYSLRQFDWLKERAEDADLVVIAGDLLDMASAVDLDVQAVVMQKYLPLCRGRTALLASSGNHDIFEQSADGEPCAHWLESQVVERVHVDYQTYRADGFAITVCPWWEGPHGRARTEELLEADAARRADSERWLWVHHNPPDEAPVCWTGKKFGGDVVLNQWIEGYQPDLVFSGHIHNAPFYSEGSWFSRIGKTVVFNPGKQPGGEPTHILVDTTEGTAEWNSIEGSDRIDLGWKN